MVAETDIVNGAIRLVGGNTVTSLTDGSKNANIANDIYDELRDDLLRCWLGSRMRRAVKSC